MESEDNTYSDEDVTWDPNMTCLRTMTRAARGAIESGEKYRATRATQGSVPSIALTGLDDPTPVYDDPDLQTSLGTLRTTIPVEVLYEADGIAKLRFDSDDLPASLEEPLSAKSHKTG